MKLAISCKVFESNNSNNTALLKQVGQKLSTTPKDCKKNLNKQCDKVTPNYNFAKGGSST
ncbi:hypothetical protein TYRP_010702 [Tyrophagus putrescentiae]|nr:hypothetical protein TYRP_010702 [Tyrophagus putrescentiae]